MDFIQFDTIKQVGSESDRRKFPFHDIIEVKGKRHFLYENHLCQGYVITYRGTYKKDFNKDPYVKGITSNHLTLLIDGRDSSSPTTKYFLFTSIQVTFKWYPLHKQDSMVSVLKKLELAAFTQSGKFFFFNNC